MTLAVQETSPPADKPTVRPSVAMSASGGAIVRSFDDLARLSQMIAKSGLAPRDMQTPEKIGVAIMWGMEIGLSPVQALQSIAVINGRPCLWGDALPALVQSSTTCEYVDERLEGEGDALVAICESKRRGSPRPKVTRFSVADAKKANLWGKAGPWQNYPKRMLQIRARAFNFRDNFADVLRGIGVAEEQQDVQVSASVPTQVQTEPEQPHRSELDDFAVAVSSDQPGADAHTSPPVGVEGVAEDAAPVPEELGDVRTPEQMAEEYAYNPKTPPATLVNWILNIAPKTREAAKKAAGVEALEGHDNIRRVAYEAKLVLLRGGK